MRLDLAIERRVGLVRREHHHDVGRSDRFFDESRRETSTLGFDTASRASAKADDASTQAGKLAAQLFQEEPKIQTRRDLRRFKMMMETGEIATADAPDAAPRG